VGGELVKPRDRVETLEADHQVDFSHEDGCVIPKNNHGNRSTWKPAGKSRLSPLIGVVIFGLGILFAAVFYRSSNIHSGSKMRSLERRIKRLEERLYRLDRIEANLEQVKEENKQFNSFNDTFIKKPITPPKSITAQTVEKQTEAVYHEVLAGETLYRISLRYNIKLDELRRLNNLEPEETIYPKQKLLIHPAGNQ
jgi:LysM repeat protein